MIHLDLIGKDMDIATLYHKFVCSFMLYQGHSAETQGDGNGNEDPIINGEVCLQSKWILLTKTGWDVQVEVARYSKIVIFLPPPKNQAMTPRTISKKRRDLSFHKDLRSNGWYPTLQLSSQHEGWDPSKLGGNTSPPTPNETKTSKGRPWQLLLGIFHGLCCDGRGLRGSKIGTFGRKYADVHEEGWRSNGWTFSILVMSWFLVNCDGSLRWIDTETIGPFCWILHMILQGLCGGCWNAWRWWTPPHLTAWVWWCGNSWNPFFWIAYLEIFDQIYEKSCGFTSEVFHHISPYFTQQFQHDSPVLQNQQLE